MKLLPHQSLLKKLKLILNQELSVIVLVIYWQKDHWIYIYPVFSLGISYQFYITIWGVSDVENIFIITELSSLTHPKKIRIFICYN